MAVVIPSKGVSLPFLLQLIFDASSRSFSKLFWKLLRGESAENTLKIKNRDFTIVIKRDESYYKLSYVLKLEEGELKTGQLRITGQEFSQVVDAVNSRIFR